MPQRRRKKRGPNDNGGKFSVIQYLMTHVDDGGFEPTGRTSPTDAPPGSPDKVETLARRAWLGQPLHHANDKADWSNLLENPRKDTE